MQTLPTYLIALVECGADHVAASLHCLVQVLLVCAEQSLGRRLLLRACLCWHFSSLEAYPCWWEEVQEVAIWSVPGHYKHVPSRSTRDHDHCRRQQFASKIP